ncbi:MAG: hypothetical protein GEU81_16785 [Nitriliruptorales bacterium]|nr:hypothetical protein [Nitriliruptorales bacterium]
MKITELQAIPIAVPMEKPLKMAVATVTERTCIVLRIRTDEGLEGFGEGVIAPYFTGETLASAVHLVDAVLTPLIVGADPAELHVLEQQMDRVVVGNSSTRSAVDIALHDLLGKAHGVPLHQLLGGKVRDEVPTIWHVSGGDPERDAADATKAVAAGFGLIKVKVATHTVERDIERVFAVREAVGPDVALLLDANQGWQAAEAIRFAKGVEAAHPALLEQPVHRDDIPGMAHVRRSTSVVIAADEGLFNARELATYLHADAAGAVIAKLIKAGGISGLRRLAAVAAASGLGIHFAGMAGETSVAAAAAVQLACTLPELRFGSGISPHYLTDDVVTQRLAPVGGAFTVPEGPGIGVHLDDEALERLRVRDL